MFQNPPSPRFAGALAAALGSVTLLLYVISISWSGAFPSGDAPTGITASANEPCTDIATNAFAACYYDASNYKEIVMRRIDKTIDFDWSNSSPDPRIANPKSFSVRWEGNFTFSGGTYSFSLTHDDGMRLLVDNKVVWDKWTAYWPSTPPQPEIFQYTMTPGVHKIGVDYYQGARNAVARVSWTGPGIPGSGTATSSTPVTTPPVSATSTNPVTPPGPTVSSLYQDVINRAPHWAQSLVLAKLGPSYADLHPGSTAEDRPTNFMPTDKTPRKAAWFRINPYQVGGPDFPDTKEFWSTSGQMGMLMANSTRASLRTIQTFAYYDHVFAEKPRFESAETITATPKPQVIAQVRNYAELQNEALVLMDNGVLQLARLQTSRSGTETNYPTIQFPPNLVPTALAVTTENQFALVTFWDTVAHTGKVAVVALEGAYLKYHTLTYMGLDNQGSWSDFKLLGYVDLPFAYPTSVAAASNGRWKGPSSTDGLTLGGMNLSSSTERAKMYSGNWSFMIATKGYAMVSSQTENKVAFLDLSALMQYMKESYLAPNVDFAAVVASRGPGDNDFPKTFAANPSIKPTLISTFTVPSPTTVLAGQELNRWTIENFKAYAASEDGTIHIFDTSGLMNRPDNTLKRALNPLAETGSFYACKNPTSMNFARYHDIVAPPNQKDLRANVNQLNNTFYIACRGDREVAEASVAGNSGMIFRVLKDTRLDDPVYVDVADRGDVVTVADFNGQRLVSFRIGNLTLWDDPTKGYGPGTNGTSDYEVGGVLDLPGKPFTISQSNVN